MTPDPDPGGSAAAATPLIVDMDGALLRTDVTFEALAAAAFARPASALCALALLFKGRAYFKRRITALARLDVALLPLRTDFVDYLRAQKGKGRALHLVSGADAQIVREVAARLALFESAIGSADGLNLTGRNKAAYLQAAFPTGFAYSGDSRADLHVWRAARSAVLAGASPSVARRARALAPIEAEFREPRAPFRAQLQALGVTQWWKNLTLFAPCAWPGLLGADRLGALAIGFVAAGCAASAAHVLRALSHRQSDPRDAAAQGHAFAALPAADALTWAALLLVGALSLAFALSPIVATLLTAFLILALARAPRWATAAGQQGILLAMGFVLTTSEAAHF